MELWRSKRKLKWKLQKGCKEILTWGEFRIETVKCEGDVAKFHGDYSRRIHVDSVLKIQKEDDVEKFLWDGDIEREQQCQSKGKICNNF